MNRNVHLTFNVFFLQNLSRLGREGKDAASPPSPLYSGCQGPYSNERTLHRVPFALPGDHVLSTGNEERVREQGETQCACIAGVRSFVTTDKTQREAGTCAERFSTSSMDVPRGPMLILFPNAMQK